MRYVALKIRPENRWFHPVDEKIAAEPGLRHGPIHDFQLLADGRMVVFYEIYGDADRVAELLETHGSGEIETMSFGDDAFIYTAGEPSDEVRSLIETANNHQILVDTPIEFTDDDEIEVTILGPSSAIQEAFTSVPSTVQVTVERTGDYRPGREQTFWELTDRQQEILLTALEMGYYEDPRETTYGEIAEVLGCTATTVGEHLRKIERYALREIAPPERAGRRPVTQ